MELLSWLQSSWLSILTRRPVGDTRAQDEEWQVISHEDAALTPELQSSPERLRRVLQTYGVMARLRAELLSAQSQAANELQSRLYKFQHLHESVTEMIARYAATIDEEGQQTLSSLREQLATDETTFHLQTESTMRAMTDQKGKQWRLAEAETHFMQSLHDFILSLPDGPNLWQEMQSALPETVPAPSEGSGNIPRLAEEYFECVGLLGIQRERLAHVERERLDDRIQRNLLSDQEKDLPSSDSDFERHYDAEIAELKQQIEQSSRGAEALRQECEANGIDIEAWRYRPGNDTPGEDRRPFILPFVLDGFRRSVDFDGSGAGNFATATSLPRSPNDYDGSPLRDRIVKAWLTASTEDSGVQEWAEPVPEFLDNE